MTFNYLDVIIYFILPFGFTLIISMLIIKYRYGLDLSIEDKNHAIHFHQVSRMGGIAIFISIFVFSTIFVKSFILILISTFSIVTFGLLEDRYHIDITYFKKIIFLSISAFALLYLSGEYAYQGGFINLSNNILLEKYIAIVIAFIGLIGFASAINFIDGLNGYSMGISFITIIFFSHIFYINGLEDIFIVSLIILGSIGGFLILNFPNGKIFLGDMGAHFMGFVMAYFSIYLTNHTNISLWYPLTILSIPVIETISTLLRRIKRKKIHGIKFSESEKEHLHHLVYNYINNRSKLKNINAIASLFFLFWHLNINILGFIYYKNNIYLVLIFVLNIIFYSIFKIILTNFVKNHHSI